MTAEARIRTIRLSEKIKANPGLAARMGVTAEIKPLPCKKIKK